MLIFSKKKRKIFVCFVFFSRSQYSREDDACVDMIKLSIQKRVDVLILYDRFSVKAEASKRKMVSRVFYYCFVFTVDTRLSSSKIRVEIHWAPSEKVFDDIEDFSFFFLLSDNFSKFKTKISFDTEAADVENSSLRVCSLMKSEKFIFFNHRSSRVTSFVLIMNTLRQTNN